MAESRIEELRRRVGRDPGSRLFAQLAEEERKAGDLNEAIRVARAGLATHATYGAALVTLGRALIESGDGAGARVALQEALRQAPDNILAGRFLGQALEALGDREGAARQYRSTLKMAPGDRQLEGRIEALERTAGEGRESAAPLLQPVPGSSLAGGQRTESVVRHGVAADELAGDAGERVAGEGPPFSSPTLAELYLRQGFAERAVEVYRQVVAERPGDSRARTRLAELGSLLAHQGAAGVRDSPEGRRRALQRTIAGLELLLGVARRR